MAKLHEGDKVSWKTSTGRTKGKVVAVKAKPFQLHGKKVKATEEDRRYLVEAKKTRARTSHRKRALKKR